ncbi:HvfC/BufC N-terminal domain-containing protein [Novosphingobium beihaiensis]|uniref:DNA-binding domain-containing protein n=1 Tax=Novosphingobium beihaiensis TaxID=2930389 RepID=A0ABT0BLQ8_9SPHN|nr:DNA-binding domain-containing protein [Novosphingobium beihaiensis]MCJ2185639.1 DNA-binding domain-containing protein [Novosphingobium beihaiensis]
MTLAQQQSRFIEGLMSNDASLPEGWQARERAGYEIYRNAYRARLIDALHETYPRTARLAGEEAFQAAAAHHLITHPPASWTLDDAGLGFAQTLETLFPADPDVAELAWIEWAMQDAFTARDTGPLDGAGLVTATASFGDRDWQDMRFAFVPGLAVRLVRHDCLTLWQWLGDSACGQEIAAARDLSPLPETEGCVVWREGLRSTFTMTSAAEAQALTAMADGAGYGAACDLLTSLLGEEQALQMAGEMLARWLANGWIERLLA